MFKKIMKSVLDGKLIKRNKPKIEIYQDIALGWRWRVIAANGKIVLPQESHRRIYHVKRAIRSAMICGMVAILTGRVKVVK